MADEHVELPELPEELIQHIQSFLDAKHAVRASVLSKLWYSAWSTNPILSVDENNFSNFSEFQNFGRTSIKRYQKLNLKLNTFKLCIYSRRFDDDDNTFTRLADELILSALTLGVNDLYTHISFTSYTLPDQVFSSICLKKLYIHGCIINLPQSKGKSRVLCSRLVSLELSGLNVRDDMMTDILLGCPLIEDLQVHRFYNLDGSSNNCTLPDQVLSSIYLKKLYVYNIDLPPTTGKPRVLCSRLVSLELFLVRVSDDMMRDILLGCPLIEVLRVKSCIGLKKINLSPIRCNLRTFHAEINIVSTLVTCDENNPPGLQNQFHNLISLKLINVKVDDLFFEFFPHRFPCLERLELERCLGPVMINIDITSNSLRYLTLKRINGLRFIKVQVPNIQNFRFGNYMVRAELIPSLSVLTASKEWKSNLTFYHPLGKDRDVQVSWWLKIRDILTELSSSKISIAIVVLHDDDQVGSISENIIQRNHILPFVENLKIQIWERGGQNSFGWLLCCRPKYLTWLGWKNQNTYEMLELAYNELKKHNMKNLTDALPCIHGLEEVDMELYDKALREWFPVRQGTEDTAQGGGEFRLRLKWTRKRLRSMIL